MGRIGARDVVLEADLRARDIRADGWPRPDAKPSSPRLILLFTHPVVGGVRYPCDRYSAWETNLRAIALSLQALRAVDRYGVTRRGEQYTGWKALGSGAGHSPSGNGGSDHGADRSGAELSPILLVEPTLDMARTISKDRIGSMIRDTPRLRGKFPTSRRREADQTLLHKTFPGGHLTLAGANSGAGLAARPIRVVLLDEVDRYPASAGAEGDVPALAIKQTTTFGERRIVFMCSTPTVRDLSRIEQEYDESDQRRFVVPCPECGHRQTLVWRHLKWESGKPETARYACEGLRGVDRRDAQASHDRGRRVGRHPPGALGRGLPLHRPRLAARQLGRARARVARGAPGDLPRKAPRCRPRPRSSPGPSTSRATGSR